MVCIPCIIAPVALFLWYRFVQPIVMKFWNMWSPQKSVKSSQTNTSDDGEKSCPFATKTTPEVTQPDEVTLKDTSTKKSD